MPAAGDRGGTNELQRLIIARNLLRKYRKERT